MVAVTPLKALAMDAISEGNILPLLWLIVGSLAQSIAELRPGCRLSVRSSAVVR
jgi:hypothetical protein